jgi:uncharacterized protein YndB with AHSA1/START domain
MKIENEIEIAAPVARVWALTVDVEAWPSFTPTMTKVERLDEGELAVGSRARIDQPGQAPRVWTVTELEPQRRFAWATRALGMSMVATHDLVPTDHGTRNIVAVHLHGILGKVLGVLLRRPLRKAITRENLGFKEAAEG